MKISINTLLIILIIIGCGPSGDDKRSASEEFDKMLYEMDRSLLDSLRWQESAFSDEFGDKTEDKYISAFAIGHFSNSATARSDLVVKLIVNENGNVGIFLYEYASSILATLQTPRVNPIGDYRISMKNVAGEIFETRDAGKWNQGGGLSIRNDKGVIDFLKKSKGNVKFLIRDEYSSSYYFEINADGFALAHAKMILGEFKYNDLFRETLSKELNDLGWKKHYYYNGQGGKTREAFIRTFGLGYFSGNAAKKNDLFAKIVVDQYNDVAILLYEFAVSSSSLVPYKSDKPIYPSGKWTVKMKNSAGEILETTVTETWNEDGGFFIDNGPSVISFFRKSLGEIDVYVKDGYYYFTINANGFTAAYNSLNR